MKLVILILSILTLVTVQATAQEYYLNYQDMPDFKEALAVAIADDLELGDPQSIRVRELGDAGDIQRTSLYIQQLNPLSPKTALILQVKTRSFHIECGDPTPVNPELNKKYCAKGQIGLIELYSEVFIKELSLSL